MRKRYEQDLSPIARIGRMGCFLGTLLIVGGAIALLLQMLNTRPDNATTFQLESFNQAAASLGLSGAAPAASDVGDESTDLISGGQAKPTEPPTVTPAGAIAQAPTATNTPVPTPTPTASPTPTPLPPLPEQIYLSSMRHEYQKLNNCGPVSLAMAASFFGKNITQFDAAAVVKGDEYDKNVSPEEMVAYLQRLGLDAVYRVNGNPEILQRLLANDVPVIVHQWLERPDDGELVGHYRVVRGYNAAQKTFQVNDPYTGPDLTFSLTQFDDWWRPFQRGYIPVYQPVQRDMVAQILGDDWDANTNWENALNRARTEITLLGDGYAHFNLAEAQLALGQVEAAAETYDYALTRSFPPHFLWYQFGPLQAYNQTGQHQRVLNMTDDLISHAGEFEEARLQRGLAYQAMGNPEAAQREFELSLVANPRYVRAQEALAQLSENN